jgi:hypothetical protein
MFIFLTGRVNPRPSGRGGFTIFDPGHVGTNLASLKLGHEVKLCANLGLVLCLRSLFKKYGFAIKPFSLLRDHFRDLSFVLLKL